MKRYLLTVFFAMVTMLGIHAQKIAVCFSHNGIKEYALLTDIDSIYFDQETFSIMYVQPIDGSKPLAITLADISDMSCVASVPESINIVYSGSKATVENPFFLNGVNVDVEGADVTVSNSNVTTEYTTSLSGETTNGSFTYNGDYKTTIELNGVSITSTKGAAIDIECGKRINLYLKKNTVNTLIDAANGKQKAALYCKGHMEIDKAGTLNVTGNAKHAISAKEYIQLKKSSGTINILGAKSDGIHCNQYFIAKGYTVNINNVSGDGIQAEMQTLDDGESYEEDYENGTIQIVDGNFNITLTEDGGLETTEQSSDTPKSYKVYVAKTTGTNGGWGGNRGGNYWNNIYLYKSDGTLVQQLTSTVTLTGTNGQALQFYVYDFKQSDSGTYYFKSDNYQSMGGSYVIQSATFNGPQSGIDYYYQISSSYTTSGTTRLFTLSSVQETYGGNGSRTEGDTYYSTCLKAQKGITISGGMLELTNSGSMSKAIKAGNSDTQGTVTVSGGTITCNTSGDMYLNGTDATYSTAIKTDSYVGTGGTIVINSSKGKAVHGISADEKISISGGDYTITNTCDGYIGSNDTYTAKAITCDKNVTITGGKLNLKMSGTGGKCIKADGELIIGAEGTEGPDIIASTTGAALGSSSSGGMGGRPGQQQQTSTSSSSKAIKAIGQVTVNSGKLTVTTATNGAEGLESKTSVLIKGGNHYFKCYDDCINSAGVINFAGGNTVCYATNNDAVDSNYGRSGAITISGGNVFAYTTAGGAEEGLDCDNNSYIIITGGIAVSAGGNQGGGGGSSQSVGSASQNYYLGNSPSNYSSANYYTLYNTSGVAMCTYKFEGNVSNSLSLLTAPNLGKGNITIKQGTAMPASATAQICNGIGNGVFFIAPTVTPTSTTATVATK